MTAKPTEPLSPCPFCGARSVDPVGWMDGDGRCGPECEGCGATAENIDRWNRRALAPAVVESIVDAIWSDISGRKGIGDELERIDEDVQLEIKSAWKKRIDAAIDQAIAKDSI